MSVYIKGMEMPKSCNECRFFADAWCFAFEADDWRKAYYKPPEGERRDNCPLIPVPDHGDLIDRDKLEKDIDRYIGGEESRSRFHHWVQVQDVVIPREKGAET